MGNYSSNVGIIGHCIRVDNCDTLFAAPLVTTKNNAAKSFCGYRLGGINHYGAFDLIAKFWGN